MADLREPLDIEGRLTTEALEHINNYLAEKFTQACPSCAHHEFVVAERIYAPIALSRNRAVDYGNTYPLIMLLCSNCAHVMPFAARVMGFYGGPSA